MCFRRAAFGAAYPGYDAGGYRFAGGAPPAADPYAVYYAAIAADPNAYQARADQMLFVAHDPWQWCWLCFAGRVWFGTEGQLIPWPLWLAVAVGVSSALCTTAYAGELDLTVDGVQTSDVL